MRHIRILPTSHPTTQESTLLHLSRKGLHSSKWPSSASSAVAAGIGELGLLAPRGDGGSDEHLRSGLTTRSSLTAPSGLLAALLAPLACLARCPCTSMAVPAHAAYVIKQAWQAE